MIGTTNTLIDKKGGYITPDMIETYSLERLPNTPYPFYGSNAVVYNNEVHIMGSANSSHYTKHYKWDGNTWTFVKELPIFFYDGQCVVYNNEIHILGSEDFDYGSIHYKWDGNEWISVSTLPYEFFYGAISFVFEKEINRLYFSKALKSPSFLPFLFFLFLFSFSLSFS